MLSHCIFVFNLAKYMQDLAEIVAWQDNSSNTCKYVMLQTDKGFDRGTYNKQMAVMRGQVSGFNYILYIKLIHNC